MGTQIKIVPDHKSFFGIEDRSNKFFRTKMRPKEYLSDLSDLSASVKFLRFAGLLDLSKFSFLSDLLISELKKNGWTDGMTDGQTII